MPASSTPRELFLEQLTTIERIVGSVCRRNGCHSDDAEEFASKVKLKLIEDDYAVLRKFRGKSRLSTYLTTVIHNQFRDFRIARWGKWRPSAAAKRAGTVAVQLEILTERDGHPLAEAVQMLQENFNVEESSAELERLAARLPRRTPRRRFESLEAVPEPGVRDGVGRRVEDRDLSVLADRTEEALDSALGTLSGEDRLLLRMHYQEGFTVAQIARTLDLDQRRLYSRFERLRRDLRGDLERGGVTSEAVTELLEWPRRRLEVDFGSRTGNVGERSV